MSNQIVITSGAKLRDLDDVIVATDGILSSVAFNVANGVPRLDENGKILVSQLPNSVMEFKGVWNAATNTPTLVNGTGNAGDVWLCNVAGTVNFGAGPIAFAVGDYAVYTGTVWARSSGATGTVTSVGVSRDGNALTITGSPVTTSGTINLGFSGDNTQYINGAGNLTTFPTLITSIGLTMPAAFGVSNSPLTANGTIGVSALGYPSQYIRGDGTLADFPTSGGGGSSVSYYLNGGTSQGTIGGTTYYEMSKIANTGAGVDFSKTGDGFITAFLTDAGDPALLQIPAGNWNYQIYASMSANGGTPEMYAELYVYDGTTFTLLSTSAHEILYDGVNLNLYTFAMAVPETVLTVTDRIAIKLYATNSGGKTTTIHTQNGHLCQVITTFTTGLTALNGLTSQVQYFATGTSGSDFNIVSSVSTHTFNLPTASATKRGALSSADWSTFNGKQDYITAGTTLEYWRGDKTWQTLNTSIVPELTNLYFTDARARTAISLTTTGSTGASTYNNSTGVLNIPNYADQYVGTVTSVAMTVPTGLSISGSPITSSGTLAVTFTAGYSIPTTSSQTNWDTAYTNRITSLTTTGSSGAATLVSNTLNIPNYTLSGLGGQPLATNLTSLSGLTYASTSFVKMTAAGTFSLDTNTYLTTTSAASTYLPLAGGTMSGSITYSGYLLKDLTSVTKASIIINWAGAGYFGLGPNGSHIIRLDQADPTTGAWAGATDVVLQLGTKTVLTDSDIGVTVQAKLNNPITGTGSTNKIAKFSGSTTLADSYITDAAGLPTTITKDGSAITASLVSINPATGTSASILNLDNSGAGSFYIGRQNSAGNSILIGSLDAYAAVIGHTGSQTLNLVTAQISRLAIDGSGNSIFSGSLRLGGSSTAKQFVVNQGTTSGYFLSGEASGTELAYWYYNTTEIQFSSKSSTRSLQFLTTDLPRMTILSGGNIGIGTTSPNQKLEIASTTGTAQIRLNSASGGQNASIELYQGGSPKWEIGTGMATSSDLEIRDRVAGANKITIIGSTGNVLINTPTGVTGGGAFQVNGNVNINGVFQINGVTIGGGGGSGVTGSGTTNYITKWTGSSTLGNSIIQDNGSTVTMIGAVETVARFATSGDSTIIIGGNAAQGVSSGEQYITYQNGTTNSNAWMVGMDDGEDWRFAYGAVGEITDANSLIKLTQGGNFIIGQPLTDNGSKLQVYGDLYVSGSSVYAGGVTYSGTQTFNGLVYLNSTTYAAVGQSITWKGSSGTTYDFSISNSGTVPYILSSAEIDLNAPIGMRYGLIYTFKGNGSSAYNVNILNSGVAADELQFLGGLKLTTTTCGFVVPRMTTTQKNALSASVKVAGCIVYDTTSNLLQAYNGSTWNNLW
mgnify:CR=1 FL=1